MYLGWLISSWPNVEGVCLRKLSMPHLFFSIVLSHVCPLGPTVAEHTDNFSVENNVLDFQKVIHSKDEVIITVKKADTLTHFCYSLSWWDSGFTLHYQPDFLNSLHPFEERYQIERLRQYVSIICLLTPGFSTFPDKVWLSKTALVENVVVLSFIGKTCI